MLITTQHLYEIAMAADNFEELAGELIELGNIEIKGDGDGTAQFIVAFNELKDALSPYRQFKAR